MNMHYKFQVGVVATLMAADGFQGHEAVDLLEALVSETGAVK